MLKYAVAAFALGIWSLPAPAGEKALEARDQWPQWRGPLASGVAPHGDPR
jgi:hypothetical protein